MKSLKLSPSIYWNKLKNLLFGESLNDHHKLKRALRSCARNKVIDTKTLKMLEGVLTISSIQVRDIMIPRAQMICVKENQKEKDILPKIVNSGHSRFPVMDKKNEIIGVLMAKDLLKYYIQHKDSTFVLKHDIIRTAMFVPESKRLDILLEEFRAKHNHLAIVVDEYGSTSGLVTIEDILEEIVGEIEDEFDHDTPINVKKIKENTYLVDAKVSLEDFNELFNSNFLDHDVDTIGGYVIHKLEIIPKVGVKLQIGNCKITIEKANAKTVEMLKVVFVKGVNA
ncbi:MAG: magnesium/cobalt efflux protein [Thiotrichales bacterium]|nr:MAG: magnesium/cobalt efflux protein [Thiotrichales bacterium]